MRTVSYVLVVFVAGLTSCLSSNPPLEIRYFRPPVRWSDGDSRSAASIPLRLERATASAHLREALVWRQSDVEFGFDETSRWVAEPSALVDEALSGALFVAGPFARSTRSNSVSLAVHVTAFEEVLGDDLQVEIGIRVSLSRADGVAGTTRLFVTQSAVGGPGTEEVARAMGVALHRSANEVAAWLTPLVAP